MNLYYILILCKFFQALQEMAVKNEGKIICPKTRRAYGFDKAEKVFIMWRPYYTQETENSSYNKLQLNIKLFGFIVFFVAMLVQSVINQWQCKH